MKNIRGVLVLSGVAVACSSCATGTIRVLSGLTSHTLCSAVFVSGLDADQVYGETILPTPGVKAISWGLHYEVDRQSREVRASVLGGFRTRAVFREGRGCTVLTGQQSAPAALEEAQSPRNGEAASDPLETPREAVVPADPSLRVALDHAFAETQTEPHKFTKAVVVVHNGRVVAERYAEGFGVDTRLLGWSATKSITAALIGVLVRQGRLEVNARAPILEWSGPSDPRREITVAELLRMTSGIDVEENNSGADKVSEILYTQPDLMAPVKAAGLRAPPGSRWKYTSGNTWALSRIIGDLNGGTPAGFVSFARRELFDPLGMKSIVVEFDAAGTQIGSSYAFASARDWARLGLLYLNDGVVGARRILPEGWVAWASSLTPGATKGYGAGVWTNLGDSVGARERISWGMPADSYFALGFLGQYVVVVPSRHLVVVRMGVDHLPDQDMQGVSHFVGEVVRAIDAEGSP